MEVVNHVCFVILLLWALLASRSARRWRKLAKPRMQPLKLDAQFTLLEVANGSAWQISFPEGAPLEEVFIKIELFNNQK